MCAGWLAFMAAAFMSQSIYAAELQVPASTAYFDPDPNGASVRDSGVTKWRNPKEKLSWFGEIRNPGSLSCSIILKKASDSKFRLSLAGQSHEATTTGSQGEVITLSFGSFEIKQAGYQRFELELLSPPGTDAGQIRSLKLEGDAVKDAHFNLKPHRNAASVHLVYPVPKGTNAAAFYCEITGIDDPLHTYYMACGWHRGYFGMQVNSPTERQIIFSVWDSGNEGVSRQKVASENRVALMGKGEDVYSGDFGNEGTGGHSHLKFDWKTGELQRFLVTAQPVDGTFTIYSGYYFRPDKKEWMLISSWKAPREGGYLHGLYSFSENFGGENGHIRRKALYGNQWIRTEQGQWIELNTSTFSHDDTGKADRLDRFMGVENGQFFLSHGGFVPGFTQYGEKICASRPTGKAPV